MTRHWLTCAAACSALQRPRRFPRESAARTRPTRLPMIAHGTLRRIGVFGADRLKKYERAPHIRAHPPPAPTARCHVAAEAKPAATRAGAPLPISTSPARCNVIGASRMVGRPTPKRARRSLGRQSIARSQSTGQNFFLNVGSDLLKQLSPPIVNCCVSSFHTITLAAYHAILPANRGQPPMLRTSRGST